MIIRIQIFVSAVLILGIGFYGVNTLEKEQAMPFLMGCMTLGGGLLICGFFTLAMRWHGIVGAGVLALLGAGRGILNFPDIAAFLIGDRPRGIAPLMEFFILLLCVSLLLQVLRCWSAEKIKRLREE